MNYLEALTQFFYWSGIIWWCCIIIMLTVIIITRPGIMKEKNKRIYQEAEAERLEVIKTCEKNGIPHGVIHVDYEDGTEQHPYIHKKDSHPGEIDPRFEKFLDWDDEIKND